MATSGTTTFESSFDIDDIIQEAYDRIGIHAVSGYQLKTAKRSLNLLFSEWGNRELHYWEIANQSVPLINGVNTYTFFRTTADGTQTDEANTVHIAAFVGCTYHCG